jgi:TonB family protein
MFPFNIGRGPSVRGPRCLGWSMVGALAWGALVTLPSRADDSQDPQSLYLPGIMITADAKPDSPSAEGNAPPKVVGRCDILMWITADRFIRVAQVIKSTGYARLDEACLHSAIGQKMKAALGTAGPIDSWAILPVTWSFGRKVLPVPDRPDAVIGPLAPNQVPRVSVADYPAGAKGRGEHGICWVHVKLSESGERPEIKVTQSSGSTDLDNATLVALRAARFSPGFSNRQPVSSEPDVFADWVLPDAPVPASSTPSR